MGCGRQHPTHTALMSLPAALALALCQQSPNRDTEKEADEREDGSESPNLCGVFMVILVFWLQTVKCSFTYT